MIDRFLLRSRSPLRYVGTPLQSYRSGGACFYCFSMFSFAGVKLWPNCQPGVLSWDLGHYFFGCCLVNSCGGLFRWAHLALGSTWEGAPCQVGTRFVKLAGLSSKSTCNICCIWSSGWMFGLSIPVSSLQYQLIGKLLGGSCFPVGELSQN